MARNKMTDVNDHIIAQLERLGDDMTAEELEMETKRAKAIVGVAKAVVDVNKLQLDAAKFMSQAGVNTPMPTPLKIESNEQ